MVLGIGSIQIFNPQVRRVRNSLLLRYSAVMAFMLGSFATAAYQLFVYECNRELNDHLEALANSASSTLGIIQHEYRELEGQGEDTDTDNPLEQDSPQMVLGSPIHQQEPSLPTSVFQGESEIRLRDGMGALHGVPNDSGLEWYDEYGHLIVIEGNVFPGTPLLRPVPEDGDLFQDGSVRSFVLPVYANGDAGDHRLIGYVRASESTIPLDNELMRLRWGLGVSSLAMFGVMLLGSAWLTRESLKPIVSSFEMLQQFTADASHELRNPLTAIRASVAVMQRHPERIHSSDVEKIAAIASASTQMSQLVDDLLLLTRMEQHTPDRHHWRMIALDEMLEDSLNLFMDAAEEKAIALKGDFEADIYLHGDASQLQRLWGNLLSNALRYTPSGGTVVVTLNTVGDRAMITVQDTGIGIAPDHLSRIFDRFWRADTARSFHQDGSGLGLAIARTIVRYHRGQISVTSQLGVGSTFYVTFPLATSPNAIAQQTVHPKMKTSPIP
jgi:two-component system OmpR family sensor kinase